MMIFKKLYINQLFSAYLMRYANEAIRFVTTMSMAVPHSVVHSVIFRITVFTTLCLKQPNYGEINVVIVLAQCDFQNHSVYHTVFYYVKMGDMCFTM